MFVAGGGPGEKGGDPEKNGYWKKGDRAEESRRSSGSQEEDSPDQKGIAGEGDNKSAYNFGNHNDKGERTTAGGGEGCGHTGGREKASKSQTPHGQETVFQREGGEYLWGGRVITWGKELEKEPGQKKQRIIQAQTEGGGNLDLYDRSCGGKKIETAEKHEQKN